MMPPFWYIPLRRVLHVVWPRPRVCTFMLHSGSLWCFGAPGHALPDWLTSVAVLTDGGAS